MLRFAPDAPLTQPPARPEGSARIAAVLPPARYVIEPADQLIFRPLTDLLLIYHRRSGQTHMVVSPVPEILAAMDSTCPVSAAELLDRLSAEFDAGDDGEALAALGRHLEELAALGLVHRA